MNELVEHLINESYHVGSKFNVIIITGQGLWRYYKY